MTGPGIDAEEWGTWKTSLEEEPSNIRKTVPYRRTMWSDSKGWMVLTQDSNESQPHRRVSGEGVGWFG